VLKQEVNHVRQSAVIEGRLVALRFGGDSAADFAQCVALNPDMKSSLERRINQLQAQFPIRTRR
jgi:hypothetical protein